LKDERTRVLLVRHLRYKCKNRIFAMNYRLILSLFLLCFCLTTRTLATHIVGAELFYECTDPVNHRYRITLKLYRDCKAGEAPFDNIITLFAFSSNTGQAVRYIDIPLPLQTPKVEPEDWDACVGRPYDLCIEEGVYVANNVYLPPVEGGYDLAWARCCRNQAITNLANPLGEGVTYLAHVPGPEDAACNNMPQFKQFPPIFLCANDTFAFDHSAEDSDGDSLSYAVTDPYTGINIGGLGAGNPRQGGNQPIVDRFNNPLGPPPYQNVQFRNGFSFDDPFGSGDFNIDPTTGLITATPNRTGIFVFSISVFEWRNGKLLSENRRDYQIHVIECEEQGAPPVITHDLGDLPSNNDTIFIEPDRPFCYDFTVTDENPADRLTVFPVSAPFGRGFAYPPLATIENVSGSNPLTGQVCWQPACEYAGQVIPLIIGARDIGDCPSIANVFDTVWVKIIEPPNNAPFFEFEYDNELYASGDTISVQAGDSICYDFRAIDPNTQDSLTLEPGEIFEDPGGPVLLNQQGVNPITGTICWETLCDDIGKIIPIPLYVEDNAKCATKKGASGVMYIQVLQPPNDPPVLVADLVGNVFNGDTIFVNPNEPLNFRMTSIDPNDDDIVSIDLLEPFIQDTSVLFFDPIDGNPAGAPVSWTPSCEYEGQLVRFVFNSFDNGPCSNELSAFDTVYVKVGEEVGEPPIVELDRTGTVNDTLFVNAEDSICLDFLIGDLTPQTGLDYQIRFEVLDGTELSLADTTNVIRNGDSITGTICLKTDCSNGGSVYRLIGIGLDSKVCEPLPETQDTLYVKVNTSIFAQVSEDMAVCEGEGGVTLDAEIQGGNAPYQYQWNCKDPDNCGISDPFASSPTVNPSRTTTYFLQVTDSLGCTSEFDSVTITVNPHPVVNAGENIDICVVDDSIQLEATVINQDVSPGPYTYTWFPTQGISNPNIANPKVLPDTTTIYNVIVEDANGCSSDATGLDTLSTVAINVIADIVADAGTDLEICEGDSISLLGSASGAGIAYTYTWTPDESMDDPNVQNPRVSPTETTTYVLTVSAEGCEGKSDSVEVVVHPTPVLVAADTSYEACANTPVSLGISAIGNPDTTVQYEYTWAPGLGLDDPNSPNPVATLVSSVDYEVSAINNFGCESEPTIVPVNILPTPLAEAGTDDFVCAGDSIQLQGSYSFLGAEPDSSQITYQWSPADNLSASDVASPWVKPEQTMMYRLVVDNGFCPTEDSVRVDVFLAQTVEASSDTNLVCSGTEVQLFAVGGNGDPSYSWFPAESLDNASRANPVATPQSSTVYRVVIEEQGCTAEDSIQIDVLPFPEVAIEGSDDIICRNDTVNFIALSSGLSDLLWVFGDGTTSTVEQPGHVFTDAGTFNVELQGTSEDGCIGTAGTYPVTVIPGPDAAFTSDPAAGSDLVAPDNTVTFTDQSADAITYLWNFGDGNIDSTMSPVHTFEEEGDFEVLLTVTDAEGCIDTATAFYTVSLQRIFIPNVFTPNDDGVLDRYTVVYRGEESFTMKIFDRWGKLMFETTDPETGWPGITTDGTKAEDGIYYYIVKVGGDYFKGHITLLR